MAILGIFFIILLLILNFMQMRDLYNDSKKYDALKSKLDNCKSYSFRATSQPNFITVELCDGSLASMVIAKETKLCVKRIISVSAEITLTEISNTCQ